jgi:chemotaxis protein CheC
MLLTEDQEDILKELFNRGMGKAAGIIAEMLSLEIIISIPHLAISPPEKAFSDLSKEAVIGVKKCFDGPYKGDAIILYGYEPCLVMTNAFLHRVDNLNEINHLKDLSHSNELGNSEKDAFLKFAEIILSSFLSEIQTALFCELKTDQAFILKGNSPKDFFQYEESDPKKLVALSMEFSLANATSKGRIQFVLDPKDIEDFGVKLDRYLQKILFS